MINAAYLANAYAGNVRLIKMQTEGITHAESLTQTPYNINSLNWVVGHVVVNRDNVLDLLGEPRLLVPQNTARYKRHSEPIYADDPDVLHLERLLELLDEGQTRLEAALDEMDADALSRTIQLGEHTMTVFQRLFGFYFHDTYHTGQTDLLRQVAGKNDKII